MESDAMGCSEQFEELVCCLDEADNICVDDPEPCEAEKQALDICQSVYCDRHPESGLCP